MKVKNIDIINGVRQSINESPARLESQRVKEQDFLNLFEGIETDTQLKGIVLTEPHEQNLFIDTLYNRVIRTGIYDGLQVNNEFEFMRGENLNYGGTFSRMHEDILTAEDYDNTASPIGNFMGNTKECFSDEPVKRVVPFTFSSQQLQEAFLNPTGIFDLLAQKMKKAKDTMNLEIRRSILNTLNGKSDTTTVYDVYYSEQWLLNNDNRIVELLYKYIASYYTNDGLVNMYVSTGDLDQTNTGSMTVELGSAGAETTLKVIDYTQVIDFVKRMIVKRALEMQKPNQKFSLGDTDGKFTTSLEKGVLYIDEALYYGLQINEDMLFGSDSKLSKLFSKIITYNVLELMDEDTTWLGDIANSGDVVPIFYILDEKSIEYRLLLETTLDWTNPRALYTNYFTHYWYSILVDPYLSSFVCILSS